jgi:hypothetical protein
MPVNINDFLTVMHGASYFVIDGSFKNLGIRYQDAVRKIVMPAQAGIQVWSGALQGKTDGFPPTRE